MSCICHFPTKPTKLLIQADVSYRTTRVSYDAIKLSMSRSDRIDQGPTRGTRRLPICRSELITISTHRTIVVEFEWNSEDAPIPNATSLVQVDFSEASGHNGNSRRETWMFRTSGAGVCIKHSVTGHRDTGGNLPWNEVTRR